jgi:hypothetical protein
MMLHVLVTGSRSWSDRETVRERFAALPSDFVLIHGGAKGLDTIAGEIYTELTGRKAIVVRPDYDRYYFKVAPLLRNETMLDLIEDARNTGEEVLVIGFKDLNSKTNGTNNCIESAKLRGLPFEVIQKSSIRDEEESF